MKVFPRRILAVLVVTAAASCLLAGCTRQASFFDEAQTEADKLAAPPLAVETDSTRELYVTDDLRVFAGRPVDFADGICVLLEVRSTGEVSTACTSSPGTLDTPGLGLETPDYIVHLVSDDYSATHPGSEFVAPNVMLTRK